MIPKPLLLPLVALPLLAGCDREARGPHRLGPDEVLLQVSATGRADARPTEARFSAGVSSIAATSEAATAANSQKMNAVVDALKALGVTEDDIQTQQLSVGRIDWGANRNKFEASNTVSVRIRKVDTAGAAIAAVTRTGANLLSGPDLQVGDPEAASRGAYAQAYKAARARADTYAEAAGLRVARVLSIRDGIGQGPAPDYGMELRQTAMEAEAAAPPPVLAGTSTAQVVVSVDFALAPN